jgi:8-oxo-dGTP diphosphatase
MINTALNCECCSKKSQGLFNLGFVSIRSSKGDFEEALLCSECFDKYEKYSKSNFKSRVSILSFLFGVRPVITVDAIVERDSKFLLIKRKNPPFGWALPGGFMDTGETVQEAVIRELREETGLMADKIKLINVVSDPKRDPRFHAVSIVFAVMSFTGEACAADDASELDWFSFEEIQNMEIAFDHKELLNMSLSLKGL